MTNATAIHVKRVLCTSVLATLASYAGNTTAQSTDVDTGIIAEVIVTAQKREQQLSDVPISITMVSAEILQESGIKTGSALQGMVPGLTINSHGSYGGAPVSIRGTSGLGGAEDPVATYIDGVYFSSGSFAVSSLSDIASIEVVRGPQGTLQGRNATAGAILIRTADPERELGGYIRTSIADPMEYRVEGALTGALTDTLSARLSADYFDEEGWAKNLYDGERIGGHRTKNARAVVLWQPNDAFNLRFMGNYQDRVNSLATARWAYTEINPNPALPAQITTPHIPPLPQLAHQVFDRNEVNMNIEPKNHLRTPSAVLQVEYDFGPVSLISITGASEYTNKGVNDSDSLAMTDRQGRNHAVYTGHSFSQELRLQSSTDQAIDWIFGLYYARAQSDMDFHIVNEQLSVAIRQDSNFRTDQVSVNVSAFADATWHISDQFKLTGGLRYSEEDKDFESHWTLTNLTTGALLNQVAFDAPKKNWSDTSYRGKFSWEPNDDVMLYLSHSKGFKAGGFNGFGVGPQPGYDPETLVSNEAGIKAYLWNRRAYIAASIYDNDYDNLQVTSGVPSGGVVITNAASAEIKGFEIEAELRPIDGLTLLANLAYIDSEFTHFPRAPNIIGVQTDVSGNRLTNTPEWQYFLQTSYTTHLNQDWSMKGIVNWRWRDTVYFHPTDQNLPHLRGDSLGELGARFAVTYQPQALTIALYGTNLNDDRGVTGQGLTFAYPQAFFNRPRVVGVQIDKNF